MAFTRALFGLVRAPDPWDWRGYPNPEAYAVALCSEGLDADVIRELLRSALDESRAEVEGLLAEVEADRRAADMAEARRDATVAAAHRLLADVGWREREDWVA